MQVPCEISSINTLKKGMKIVLSIGDKDTPKVMKDIYNFMQRPITVEFLVDANKTRELMKQISPDQRKKVYAILKDMASYMGDTPDNVKDTMKNSFIQATEYEDFSLSDCSKDLAGDFIEYLIRICFQMGIPLSESPAEGFNDIEKYLAICLEQKKCCICGQPGEVHHWDAIGMGRNRTKYDDTQNRKICLCREHHTEAHTIGPDEFEKKYHVYGI
jgi:hypothetical protein